MPKTFLEFFFSLPQVMQAPGQPCVFTASKMLGKGFSHPADFTKVSGE
jgi:hypothetical protein